MNKRIGIIGGGIGGLSAACFLAKHGADVVVIEKNEQLGGRASVLETDGFKFDMGPSWYLMPDVFDRFFAQFDRQPSDYYELIRLDPHYRIFFKDNTRLDVTADRQENISLFESLEPGAGTALTKYLDEAKYAYQVGMDQFVYTDRPKLRDYVDFGVLRHARRLSLTRSMQSHVERYFDHPKLQQVMQYSLVFLGGSPNNTPAIYKLMSYVDFEMGVYYPTNGMGAVVDAVAALGTELGVTYRTDEEVTGIQKTSGDFHISTTNSSISVDLVLSNADYVHTEQDLLTNNSQQYDAAFWNSRTYAPSAFIMYLGIEGTIDDLAHHTLVLPTDWDAHFQAIFNKSIWPSDPSYYICHTSATDESVAPPGHSALFVLVPIAPGLEDSQEQCETFRDQILKDIATNTGVDLSDRIVLESQFSVSDFAGRYNATKGTALGLAHTLRQTGPFRPNIRSSTVAGLYYTGAYTRPGIGVPMCLISGEHAANRILTDYDQMKT